MAIFTATQWANGTKVTAGVGDFATKLPGLTAMNNPVQYSFGSEFNDAKCPPNTDFMNNVTVSASGHMFQQSGYEQDRTAVTVNQGVVGGPTTTDV